MNRSLPASATESNPTAPCSGLPPASLTAGRRRGAARAAFLVLLGLAAGWSRLPAETEEGLANRLRCGKEEAWRAGLATAAAAAAAAAAAGPDATDRLKYAPSREIQILHFTLDVTPDFKARSVAGSSALRFKPIARSLAELRLDAIDLSVAEVTSTEPLSGWQASDHDVVVTFEPPVPVGREVTLRIRYSGVPVKGLYFRTPEMGYGAGDSHLWTQGEPSEARHWFPCVDAPNAKFTSEMICRVPEGMTVLSNGRLVSDAVEAGTGLRVVRWLQDKPHANYLIALCAGYFKKVEDKYGDLPLALYTPASQIAQAAATFKDTKDMMQFFEKEIGVPYPWAKYYQVCVEDFGWGGMENTSLTVLNDRTLFTEETETLRDSTPLVAHELAHQWFGDLVTCKDWAHLWLNEGAATYYEALYEGHKHGRDMFLYVMRGNAQACLGQANDTKPMVRRDFNDPEEQFGFHAYPKGSWILHMLRSQLGEELYRRCLKTYLERHQYGNVTTEDLNRVVEELSGRSFDQFFDQYVYHAHHPELAVSYSWDERAHLARIAVQQTQKLSDDVLLFKVPLPVRFKLKDGTVVERTLDVKAKSEDFHVTLASAPQLVRLDPNLTLLAKLSFTLSSAMQEVQLADPEDMLGRLMVVEQLSGRAEALEKLKKVLNGDSFHAVRIAAAQSIRAIQTEEARQALVASRKQPDARVRQAVVSALAGFFREQTPGLLREVLQQEKNPDILSTAIAGLGAYARPETHSNLLAFLQAKSYRNSLADSAIGSIRAHDDAGYIAPLLSTLRSREAEFSSPAFSRGLAALAWIARNEEKKEEVREFLLGYLGSERPQRRVAAINALGALGDPKAVAPLELLVTGPKETPERSAAERAVASLRETRKPGVELGAIRGEMLSLQKENRDLRRDVDDLKKRLEAIAARAATAAAPPKSSRDRK